VRIVRPPATLRRLTCSPRMRGGVHDSRSQPVATGGPR
jgi:hypothetical protein